MNDKFRFYVDVWGDTVVLKELFLSSVLGIVLTMIGYSIGINYFSTLKNIDPGLVKGYSLMTGIVGCLVAATISAVLFKPKRVVEERVEQEEIEKVLATAGITVEEEARALKELDEETIDEMQQLDLTGLLDLREGGE